MIACMNVGVDVLSGFEAPEGGARMGAFGQYDFRGLFVTVAHLVAIIESLDTHVVSPVDV